MEDGTTEKPTLKEGHRALKENGIWYAAWIDVLRTCRVLGQFVRKYEKRMRVDKNVL